jgi:hypothetical protein
MYLDNNSVGVESIYNINWRVDMKKVSKVALLLLIVIFMLVFWVKVVLALPAKGTITEVVVYTDHITAKILPGIGTSVKFAWKSGTAPISQVLFNGCKLIPNTFSPTTPTDPKYPLILTFPAPATGPLQFTFETCDATGCSLISNNVTVQVPRKVTLAWDPLSAPELKGYKLYWGTPGNYPSGKDAGNVTTTDIYMMSGQTLTFVVTAYLNDGKETGYSNWVTYTAP